MATISLAAGPHLKQGQTIEQIRNIDIAPTILEILGVAPPPTVDGASARSILRRF